MKIEEFDKIKELYDESIMDLSKDDTQTLFNYLDEPSQWDSNRKRRTFYASDATRCERQLFYSVSGEEETNPSIGPKQLKIFALGDAIHEGISDRYRQVDGWKFYEEAPGEIHIPKRDDHEGDFLLHYRVDGILKRKFGEEKLLGIDTDSMITEFKSSADFPYTTGKNKKGDIYWFGAKDVPKYDHFAQLQLGMYGESVKYGVLHYYNKNNSEEAIHVLKLNETFVHGLIERMWDIMDRIARGELPERPYEAYPNKGKTALQKTKKVGDTILKSDWHCLYCNYADMCWGLNGAE